MSDARQRLSRMRTTLRDRSDSRTSNTRGEPHSRSPFTTGWQPVRPRELPYQVLLVRPAKSLRTAGRAASSRRRGQRHDHTMQDHTDGEEHHTKSDTSGCVGGASGVPPTQLPAVERLYSGKTAVQLLASGTSGVYRCHARARTRTPAHGHTYARLRKVGIPPTSPTRVGGTRRSYQNAEVSQ